MTSIRHGCSLDQAGVLLQQNSQRHLRSSAEMYRLFRDLPHAVARTGELSDRLQFVMKDMGYEFPRYPIPDGETMDTFLRARTMEGVGRRYGLKAKPCLSSPQVRGWVCPATELIGLPLYIAPEENMDYATKKDLESICHYLMMDPDTGFALDR